MNIIVNDIVNIIVKKFCVNKFIDYKEDGSFFLVVDSKIQAEMEQEKIADLIQNDYKNHKDEVKKIILKNLDWNYIQKIFKFELNQEIDKYKLSWKEIDDLLKEIETLIKL